MEDAPFPHPIEPGIAYCHCGKKMQVEVWRIIEPLSPPGIEIINRLRSEGRSSWENYRLALREYDLFESWGLTYKCLSCGTILSMALPRFTEEEAQEIVLRNSAD